MGISFSAMNGATLGSSALSNAQAGVTQLFDVLGQTVAKNVAFFLLVAAVGVGFLVVRWLMHRMTYPVTQAKGITAFPDLKREVSPFASGSRSDAGFRGDLEKMGIPVKSRTDVMLDKIVTDNFAAWNRGVKAGYIKPH
jgi:hypothetical protein